ncbi:hypothetical protein ASC66_01030 [Leifsonia sp. Root4]|uniref:hypothetical protein n=1 Tax=Leifsonia sp. Root4 TaxID=1736525 RepID=UPI0006F9CEF6|nr:hypothetical protein [Leifsonia sp. Root4]KQW07613.1 hypothetical protein ASC66_01030 [Leifsonia sp. Root4]
MTSLRLSATHGDATSASGSVPTIELLPVLEGDVIFTLTSDGALSAAQLTHPDDTTTPLVVEASNKLTATATVTISASTRGTYSAAGTPEGGAETAAENVVEITEPEAEGAEGTEAADGEGVSETSIGEFDWVFTYLSLVVVVAAAAAIAWITATIIGTITLPAEDATTSIDDPANGTFAVRIAAMISLIAAAAGICLSLFGAWQAALETRGRLRVILPPVELDDGTRGVSEEQLKGVAEVIDKLRRVRGSIVVVIVGAAITGAGLWVAASTAADSTPKTPAATSTPTPSAPPPSVGATTPPPATPSATPR